MTEAEPRSFSGLTEATAHHEGFYTAKKPQPYVEWVEVN